MSHHADSAVAFTRREFVGTGLVFASAALAVPAFLQRAAFGMPHAAPGMSSIPGALEDRVLVVVQLAGGNDGLNTVVPFGHDGYHTARPGLRLMEDQVLKLGSISGSGSGSGSREPLGLHPAMDAVKSLYDEGLATIVQGVGYPNPNRSHFKSMDIWQTADTNGTGRGWLGRYMDSECCGFGKGESGTAEKATSTIHPPVTIGREAPLALSGGRVQPVSFETADLFTWTGEKIHPSLVLPYNRLNGREPGELEAAANPSAAFLAKTALDARVASETIRRAVDQRPLVEYPRSGLGGQLAMVGSMIRAGMRTRIYYVTLGGFDTHAGQGGANGRHAQLLREFSTAVGAFYRDLKAQGNDGRVLTLTFSEFGRRVGQNASNGTDHGTAAPVFLFGPMVKPGVANAHPSLTDLDQGDLKFTVDFRTVYAAILDDWMGADSRAILGGRYQPAPVIRV